MIEWIDTKERLPDVHQEVFALCEKAKHPLIRHATRLIDGHFYNMEDQSQIRPTHWAYINYPESEGHK